MSKSKSRLGSGSPFMVHEMVYGLQVVKHGSMAEAVECARKGQADYRVLYPKAGEVHFAEVLSGSKALPGLVEEADGLIDEAVVIDPRLNRRHGWVRAEEGLDACAALVSMGEPNCCLDRRRLKLAGEASGEPYRVVISTDSREHAGPWNVKAFIAAAKLAQQFRPLEIWWQGAWLKERDEGVVLLAPLIQGGGLDFARVEYFLGSNLRDALSYRCLWYHANTVRNDGDSARAKAQDAVKGHSFGPKPGEYSYLAESDDFIKESGLRPTAEAVALLAAKWAGLESAWRAEVSPYSAEQSWRPERPVREDTAADRERWKKTSEEYERKRKADEEEAARQRMLAV